MIWLVGGCGCACRSRGGLGGCGQVLAYMDKVMKRWTGLDGSRLIGQDR